MIDEAGWAFGSRAVVWAVLSVALTAALAPGGDSPGAAGASVREVLMAKCLACHAGDTRKGGLDLSGRASALAGGEGGPAIEPGRPGESLLFERVEAGEMPPGGPLRPEEVGAFRAWIEAGAAYDVEPLVARRAGPDWWSLRPIRRPAPPEVRDRAWARSPIDAFVLAGLEQAGLAPAPEADRASFLRRVAFDLTGLPPSPGEIRGFVEDAGPDAHERLVDRLLASPRYGERWGRHWLDVVRFAESHGYETNQLRPNAWPYRDYVIRALNRGTPFARFVEEQLAGDAIPGADWLEGAATGFLVGGSHDAVGNAIPEAQLQQRVDDLDDMITATSTAFLGLTAQCARCHDHKFDPIRQEDYYRLQATFAGVQHADRDLPAPDAGRRAAEQAEAREELAGIERELDDAEPLARTDPRPPGRPAVGPTRNVERFAATGARSVRFTIRATSNGTEPCIDELEVWTAGPSPRNVAAASAGGRPLASSTYPDSPLHRLEHVNDGRVGNGRSWISADPGKGWVQVDWPGLATVDRVVWGRDREGAYRDRTPSDYTIEVADAPGAWRLVASSADRAPAGPGSPEADSPGRRDLIRRRDEVRARIGRLAATVRVYAGSFTTPGPTRVLRRGDPSQPQARVAPGGILSVQPGLGLPAEAPEADRRAALARWIADPANPLPARVMVNRIWQHHFGRGIVAIPGDFGFNGSRPSHPELLDWLASTFLAGGGRMKPIHRMIVLSRAYRQSSRPDPGALASDRDDRLLWRVAPRRLEAEEIRDAILSVSGDLDPRMGGPGYSLWEPNTNYVAVFTPRADLGADTFRRMIYQFKPRSQPDPTFGAFDCPDGGLVAPRRNVSTTPLQALNLLNSRFVLDQSDRFAARLDREAGPDPRAQAGLAFALAFGREPSPSERDAASALIRDHGGAALARALINANEFVYVP